MGAQVPSEGGVGAQVPWEGRVCAQACVSGWSCLFPAVFQAEVAPWGLLVREAWEQDPAPKAT